jgi:hypothetical protein
MEILVIITTGLADDVVARNQIRHRLGLGVARRAGSPHSLLKCSSAQISGDVM